MRRLRRVLASALLGLPVGLLTITCHGIIAMDIA
jgi:hypothetical protein